MAITPNKGARYNNRNLDSNIIWESEAQTSFRYECLRTISRFESDWN